MTTSSSNTILVVDDSATDLKLAGALLKRDPRLTIAYAANGQEALDSFATLIPDAVVTDLQMPEMDGLELVSAINEQYPRVPVILMTAAGSEEIAVKALQLGASSYVPKRRLTNDLLEIVNRVLETAREDASHSRLMTCITHYECEFVLENDPKLISTLVHYLRQSAKSLDLGEEGDRLRVGMALDEALLNAHYHGNLEVSSQLREKDHSEFYKLARERAQVEPYIDRRIHVWYSMTPREAIYRIRDEGPGFDPKLLPDPTDPANLEKPSGRGVLLMKTFMDEVIYNDAGNEVTMIKRWLKNGQMKKPVD